MTDFDDLRRIIEPVVSVEHAESGLLTLRFKDGTRLSFLCGATGRLNGVTVQHGPTTPDLRLSETYALVRRGLTNGERKLLDTDLTDDDPATHDQIAAAERRALARMRSRKKEES